MEEEMNAEQLRAIFPKASESFIAANIGNNGYAVGTSGIHDLYERQQRDEAMKVLSSLKQSREQDFQQPVEIAKNGRRRVTIGGQEYSFRSHWEVNYAYYLQFLKDQGHIAKWEYESTVFYFEGIRRGTTNYTPDFKVTANDGTHDWREVKGWLDPRSKTKLKRFRKYFPKEVIRLIDSAWFKANSGNLSRIVPGWSKKGK
jgi:hypothetical protein